MGSATIPDTCGLCNSWVITQDGKPMIETWSRDFVQTIADRNMEGVIIYTSLQWLQHFNRSLKQAATH
jgi:hypothetical protein